MDARRPFHPRSIHRAGVDESLSARGLPAFYRSARGQMYTCKCRQIFQYEENMSFRIRSNIVLSWTVQNKEHEEEKICWIFKNFININLAFLHIHKNLAHMMKFLYIVYSQFNLCFYVMHYKQTQNENRFLKLGFIFHI